MTEVIEEPLVQIKEELSSELVSPNISIKEEPSWDDYQEYNFEDLEGETKNHKDSAALQPPPSLNPVLSSGSATSASSVLPLDFLLLGDAQENSSSHSPDFNNQKASPSASQAAMSQETVSPKLITNASTADCGTNDANKGGRGGKRTEIWTNTAVQRLLHLVKLNYQQLTDKKNKKITVWEGITDAMQDVIPGINSHQVDLKWRTLKSKYIAYESKGTKLGTPMYYDQLSSILRDRHLAEPTSYLMKIADDTPRTVGYLEQSQSDPDDPLSVPVKEPAIDDQLQTVATSSSSFKLEHKEGRDHPKKTRTHEIGGEI